MDESNKTALVLGASGGIGGEVARQLRDEGWTVKALKRGQTAAREMREGIQWLPGDAMNAVDVAGAAQGCSVIVHAVNPPGYRDWDRLVLPMLDNSIAAARAQRATLVLPGTVYNFGPDAFPLLREDSPSGPSPARAPSAWRWRRGCARPARAACACSSCGPATSSARAPATTGSRKA